MRVLAACSLGGAGHLNPLLAYLTAARDLGEETLVVGPPAISELVGQTGFAFWPGGEPPEEAVAPIREQLPILPAAEALVLGNRELFGRLAARAMLPTMERVCSEWVPDLVLREPCEYSSAVVAGRTTSASPRSPSRWPKAKRHRSRSPLPRSRNIGLAWSTSSGPVRI